MQMCLVTPFYHLHGPLVVLTSSSSRFILHVRDQEKWLRDNKVKILDWSSQSHDLNPINHMGKESQNSFKQ